MTIRVSINLALSSFPLVALVLVGLGQPASGQSDGLESEQQQFLHSTTPQSLELEQEQFLSQQPSAPVPQLEVQPRPKLHDSVQVAVVRPAPYSAEVPDISASASVEPDSAIVSPAPPAQGMVPSESASSPPQHSENVWSRQPQRPQRPPVSLLSPKGYARIVRSGHWQPKPTPDDVQADSPQPVVQISGEPKLAFLSNPSVERLLRRAETLLYPLINLVPVTSGFGWRTHPIFGNARFHAGIDLGAPSGSPVLAVFSGKVVAAEWLGGYGNAVVLEHQASLRSLYAHLNESLVAVGQVVLQGAVIGLSGSTGNSTGPHLHFELQRLESGQWVAFDPSSNIQAAQEQLLATRTKQFTSSIPKNP